MEQEANESSLRGRAREFYEGLSSKQKMSLLTAGGLLVLFAAGYLISMEREKGDVEEERSAKRGEIVNESDLFEATLTEEVRADMARQEEAQRTLEGDVQDTRRQVAELVKLMEEEQRRVRAADAARDEQPRSEREASAAAYPAAPFPNRIAEQSPPIPVGLSSASLEPMETMVLGAIGAMPPGAIDLTEKKTNGETTVYLAPSLMNAILLTGVDTLASQGGTSNPEPIIARVQAPAVLPNSVRANLQGCFVIGSASGSLAKERVEIQAVSLSCVDYDRRAVIDEKIKGYFADVDGKKGLSGKVVTRAGALLGRAFLSGVMEGFGEAVEATAGTRAVSPLGEVRSFDAGEAATAGLGGGLSTASERLSDYYLQLAEQASPVIEVGAAKRAVLVLQEGVDLRIRRDVNVVQ